MSLKAKIEAVIYAAEEPVTLAQLAGLLGHEAAAELHRLRERQARLLLESTPGDASEIPMPSEPDLLNDEILAIEDEAAEEQEEAELAAEGSGEQPAEQETAGGPKALVAEHGAAGAAEAGTVAAGPGGSAGDGGVAAVTETAAPGVEETAVPGVAEIASSREQDRAVREYLREVLAELVRDYAAGDRGLEIREVAGGFRFATKPEYHDAVRGFVKALKPPLKLSLQALETLAVVAYKQPVTAPEISEIRGVDSAGVLGSLMARKLITTAGRKQVIGRPILYRTTKDFLLRFGLKDTSELPSIEEFEKMAGELAEQEEIPMDMTTGGGVSGGAESMHADPELSRGFGAESPGETTPGSDVVGGVDGGGSVDRAPVPGSPPAQGDATEPQADGDSSPADEVTVDGQPSGVSPSGS